MKPIIRSILAVIFLFLLNACAYRYYLGFHGPTIKNYQDIHSGVTQDSECLDCHGGGQDAQGPATSHPKFKGCLKCHND